MPRAPAGLLLLLMAGLALAATPPLETVNPWLSACDLAQPASADLQGSCSTVSTMWDPGPHCPPACSANSTTQCLYYLNDERESLKKHKKEVCDAVNAEERSRALEGLRLGHCCEHAVKEVMPELQEATTHRCRELLDAIIATDNLAKQISCEFSEVLTRYDCGQTYSIAHRCADCKEAYRRWVCSTLVPHFSSAGVRVRPCRSVCQAVEQQCPYMLPGDRAPAHPTQYAGEPTFLCLDPNIPESGEQRAKSSHGDEDCCYTHCGTPGRGKYRAICEECPLGQPSNDTPAPMRCSPTGSGKPTTCSLPPRTSSASAKRTLNKVLYPLWTAWFIHSQHQTIINLLLVCARFVRTKWTYYVFLFYWRRPIDSSTTTYSSYSSLLYTFR